jgi:drug/metabolite transporter (DMT)-like permease
VSQAADRPASTEWLALAAAAATGIQVGAATVATRSVVDQAGPVSLACLRYTIGLVCLLPPLLLGPRARLARRDLLPIGLLGIGQFGVLIVLLNVALQTIPAGRAALLFATMPLLTLLLGAVLRLEALTWPKVLGVLLTVAGVGLVLGESALAGGSASAWGGDAAALGSALVGAVCSVLYRPYLRRYPTVQISTLAMFASVLFLGTAAAASEQFLAAAPRFTTSGWGAVVFLGAASGLGYFLWLWALGHASATRVTVFLALSPITAAALGALLLGEAPSKPFLLGLASVAVGLWLANQAPRPAAPAASSG